MQRFCRVFAELPEKAASRLTLENDDISYSVSDLVPVCEKLAKELAVVRLMDDEKRR